MAYVAPTVRSVGDAVTAADYNIAANSIIAIEDDYAIEKIASNTFSAVTTFNVDNIFTSTYARNYIINISWNNTNASSSGNNFNFGLRTASANYTDGHYYNNLRVNGAGTVTGFGGTNAASWMLTSTTGNQAGPYSNMVTVNLGGAVGIAPYLGTTNPSNATATWACSSGFYTANNDFVTGSGVVTSSGNTAMGFRFFCNNVAGTISGRYDVYAYRV